jgi:hypothetical protein
MPLKTFQSTTDLIYDCWSHKTILPSDVMFVPVWIGIHDDVHTTTKLPNGCISQNISLSLSNMTITFGGFIEHILIVKMERFC